MRNAMLRNHLNWYTVQLYIEGKVVLHGMQYMYLNYNYFSAWP